MKCSRCHMSDEIIFVSLRYRWTPVNIWITKLLSERRCRCRCRSLDYISVYLTDRLFCPSVRYFLTHINVSVSYYGAQLMMLHLYLSHSFGHSLQRRRFPLGVSHPPLCLSSHPPSPREGIALSPPPESKSPWQLLGCIYLLNHCSEIALDVREEGGEHLKKMIVVGGLGAIDTHTHTHTHPDLCGYPSTSAFHSFYGPGKYGRDDTFRFGKGWFE